MRIVFAALALLLPACAVSAAPPAATISYDLRDLPARFAAAEIRTALAGEGRALVEEQLPAKGPAAGMRFAIASGEAAGSTAAAFGLSPLRDRAPQAYSIRVRRSTAGTTWFVLGADSTGAMYGGLDLAESIRIQTIGTLKDSDHAPHIARRGIKFNIPLDVRTPSYSDSGDAAQQNIPEMWSFDFWRDFLDQMARHRYNVLSLWNLHPFPSLVKVPEYPDIALDDVKRTRVKIDDTFAPTGRDMVRPEMLRNIETVRTISIEDKIRFWRDVMQYAHDRGIEVYLFTWNIYTWGVEGKHGITDSQANPATIDYFRRSVRETVLTYPLLAGMGITPGEHMEGRTDEFSREQWLWKTYGEGIRDALKVQPNRNFRLIHRMTEKIDFDLWRQYPGPFDLSYKYSVAHMYSSPAPIFAKPALAAVPSGLKVWLTLRNDDIYSFRWGDPSYVREYIHNMPAPEILGGFYMGPDGYIWGREFISTEPEIPRQLVIGKQWYSFMLWGRLTYDPTLADELFERTLAARFPEAPEPALFRASIAASKIIPRITRFFWGDIDVKWFPEACLSHPSTKGFYTVRHFIDGQTMPGTGILNISTYRDRLLAGQPMDGITPLDVAAGLEADAADALSLLRGIRAVQNAMPGKELRLTLGDLEAMAHLGNYYAAKIRGAVDLALFERTGKREQKESAITSLQTALTDWKLYAAAATRQYTPQLFNRVGYVDLNALTAKVERDIDMARNQ